MVLLAATRSWQALSVAQPAPLPPLHTDRTGTELAPWLPALAVVALAGAGALFATRAVARLVVGVLLLVAGAGIVVAALATLGDDVKLVWPLLCVPLGLVVLASGLVTVRVGRSWPGMGSRYERPSVASSSSSESPAAPARKRDPDTELWDALDRGEDPTDDDRR
ncbi:Trp biosynthesis-associated membrane protein [Dactylosporangium sp. CS-047395]|uniref:Trp biosynthesis-associated membrane protein n=1 Tax=Dactylosporangium sp. CS-047395 TaxID=3239936 RepID=UPI003D8A9847